MSNCWCFLDDFYMFSIILYVIYGMSLCTSGLHITMIVHICLLPPILIIVWHRIWGKCFILFYCFVQRIFCMPSKLVSEVLISCDGCCFDVFAVSDDDAASFGESYCVGSVVMVMVTSINHCAMDPQFTIFSMNCYGRPY